MYIFMLPSLFSTAMLLQKSSGLTKQSHSCQNQRILMEGGNMKSFKYKFYFYYNIAEIRALGPLTKTIKL